MKIRIGKTRIAFMCKSRVYKLIRIRLIDLMCKWIRLEYERKSCGDGVAFHNLGRPGRRQLLKDMLWACFEANYREYHRWHNSGHDSKKYVPTIFTIFYIINVQERDDAIDCGSEMIAFAHRRTCTNCRDDKKSVHSDNVSRTGRLLDYGGLV